MAKKKGQKSASTSRSSRGFGTKQNFDQEIKKAHKLIGQDQIQAVLNYLRDLTQRYPHQPDLLELKMSLSGSALCFG